MTANSMFALRGLTTDRCALVDSIERKGQRLGR